MKPLTRIKVSNYQSIGEADLELGAFTVVVGRGNKGKSALLRGVCAAMFNETGVNNIRLGTNEARVELHFEDDELVWTKPKSGSSRYVLTTEAGTQEYTKLGANVPDAVRFYLQVRDVEIDKTYSLRPQIHGQWDSPLLLAESAGKAARALAKLTKLDIIVQAQVAAARDLRRAKQDASGREREVEELTARLAEFPDTVKLLARMERARVAIQAADERLTILASAEEHYDLMESALARLEVVPPTVDDLDSIITRLDHMQNAILAVKVFNQAATGLTLASHAEADCDQALDHDERELDDFIKTLRLCPVCGKPMTEDHNDA